MNAEEDVKVLAWPWTKPVSSSSTSGTTTSFRDRPSFLTAVFWWVTLRPLWRDPDPGNRKPEVALSPLLHVDFETQTIRHAKLPQSPLTPDLPLVFREVHAVLAKHGVHHNDLGTHTVTAVGGRRFVTGWGNATFASTCLPILNVRTRCGLHRLGSCHMGHPLDAAACNTTMTPAGPCRLRHRRVALALRGMFCGALQTGAHSVSKTPVVVDPFLPPVVGALQAALAVCDAAGVAVDIFVHGWYGTDADLATCNAWATKGPFASRVKAVKFESLAKSFRRKFQPYVAKSEASVDGVFRHVAATPQNLQRWWSTLHSVNAAFELVTAHAETSDATYDVVVVQRSDLVTPPCLNIPGLDPGRLTILAKQNARGTRPAKVGFHDWWVAGPPALVKRYAGLAAVFPFAMSQPLAVRSIHQVFREAMETAGVPVVCLHMTLVVKARLVVGDGGVKQPKLEAVFSQCRRRDCFNTRTSPTSPPSTTHLKMELHDGRLPFTVVGDWLACHPAVARVRRTGVVMGCVEGGDGAEQPVGAAFEVDVEHVTLTSSQDSPTPTLSADIKQILGQFVAWTRSIPGHSKTPTWMVLVGDSPVPLRIPADGKGGVTEETGAPRTTPAKT